MRTNVVLGFGIVLALIGASLLVAFGLLYVKPYIFIRHMKESVCRSTHLVLTSDLVMCTCASDGSSSCLSQYPCVKVFIDYKTVNGTLISNATLYDSYETFILQRNAQQCSYHKCDRVGRYNIQAVEAFAEGYGLLNSEYGCYYDPSDTDYAILDVVTLAAVIHCMFWPSLALVGGLAIVFLYIFYLDTEQIDTRLPHMSSLERRLVQVADRNTILTGEVIDRD